MGFSAFFTSIGLLKSRGQLYYFSQRFAMVETKLRLATRAPPDLTEKAKRIRASPFLLNLPRRSSGAAPARRPAEPAERSRAAADSSSTRACAASGEAGGTLVRRPAKPAERLCASPASGMRGMYNNLVVKVHYRLGGRYY